jgi:hypothetical protein
MPTTHVIDWNSNNAKPPFVVETDPATIYGSTQVTIKLFSPHKQRLYSAHGTIAELGKQPQKAITETVDLSGGETIAARYPIKEVITARARLAIVDEVTREAVVIVGGDVMPFLDLHDWQLSVKNSKQKLHGSIDLVYKTYDAQVWWHPPFRRSGRATLFAFDEVLSAYEPVTLAINEQQQSSNLRIEGRFAQPIRGYNPYHAVVIYGGKKDAILVKTNVGSVEYKGVDTHEIRDETVNFSGLEFAPAYPITKFTSLIGFFFDIEGVEVQPKFRLEDGKVKSDISCYGGGVLHYTTSGLWYNYNAQVKTDGVSYVDILVGLIYAAEKGRFDNAVTYQVPLWQTVRNDPIDFYTVSRKVLSQKTKTWEMPPEWDNDDNTYPSLPDLGDDELPEAETGFVSAVAIEVGSINAAGQIDISTHSNKFFSPFFGEPENPDAVYSIEENIPEEVKDSSVITQMQIRIKEAKERWGIV